MSRGFAARSVEEFGRPTCTSAPVGSTVWQVTSSSLLIGNSVVKARAPQKPTIQRFASTVTSSFIEAANRGVDRVVMPRMGSGLDRLPWHAARSAIAAAAAHARIPVTVAVLDPSTPLLPDVPWPSSAPLPTPFPTRIAAVCAGARVTGDVGACPTCLPHHASAGGGPEGAPATFSVVGAAAILLRVNPGCGADECKHCSAWRAAVAKVSEGFPPTVSRAHVVACLVRTHLLARSLGFRPHQTPSPVDKVEDGSLLPAPDSPALARALSEAQAELDRHTTASSHPVTPDPTRFNTSTIVRDAAALERASSTSPPTRDCTDLLSPDDFIAVLGGVAADLVTGSLRVIVDGERAILSHPFVVWQNGKPRVCVNFRPVNEHMTHTTTSLPRARDLALARRRWLVKLDLKSAFRRVGVPSGLSRILTFSFGGVRFQYTTLPFGWSFSPEIFADTLSPAIARAVEAIGPHASVVVYVDDIAIAARSPEEAVEAATILMRVLREEGFVVSSSKTFLRPVEVLRFLGLLVRAGDRPAVGIAPSTVAKARKAAAQVRAHGCLPAMATVWGLTAFAAYSAAPELSLSRASLDAPVAAYLADRSSPHISSPADITSATAIVDAVVDDLARAHAEGLRDVLPSTPRRRVTIVSDASASGGAARIEVERGRFLEWRRPWSVFEAGLPSTVRELICLHEALEFLAALEPARLNGAEVVWVSDSSSAVYATASWAAGSECVRAAISRIRTTAAVNDVSLQVSWCPREDPTLARVDARSRFGYCAHSPWFSPILPPDESLDALHGSLSPPPTLHFAPAFGRPLMASRYASQWPAVPSSHPRPHPRRVSGVDILDWRAEHVWASPPRAALLRLMSALSTASRQGPWAALTLACPESWLSDAVLVRADPWRIRSAPLCEEGTALLRWDPVAGRWGKTAARGRWAAITYAGCTSCPVLLDRVLTTPELLRLLHASGFPPHPGPRTSVADAWTHPPSQSSGGPSSSLPATSLRDRSTRIAHHTRSVASAFAHSVPHPQPHRPLVRGRAFGTRLGLPPGHGSASSPIGLPPPPLDSSAICIAAAEAGSLGDTTHPSIGEVLSALAAEDPGDAARVAARAGVWPRGTELAQLRAQMACALAEVDSGVGLASQARGRRAATGLLDLAMSLGVGDVPMCPFVLDALATAWSRSRLRRPAAIELDPGARITSPPGVYADIGAVAARLRRRFPVPVFRNPPTTGLGPLTTALLLALGGSARHDHSPKRVVWGWELRWGIEHHLDVVALHPTAVGCIVTIGGSMWRSIYVRHLRRCDVAGMPVAPSVRFFGPPRPPVEPGLTTWDRVLATPSARPSSPYPTAVLRWNRAHKTNRFAGTAGLPANDRFGFVAAPWALEVVHHFVPSSPTNDTSFLFADPEGHPLSYSYLSRVLRMLLAGLPDAQSATLHGLRLGIDAELRHLGVPDVLRDLMGWWRRLIRRMGEHYESEDAAKVVLGNSLWGSSLSESLAPGIMASSGDFRGEPPMHPLARLMPSPPPATATSASATDGCQTAPTKSPLPRARRPTVTTRTCGACGRTGHIASNRLCPEYGKPRPSAIVSIPGDDGSESDDSEGDKPDVPLQPPRTTLPPESIPAFVPLGGVGSALLRATAQASTAAALSAAAVPGANAAGAASSPSASDAALLRAAASAAVSLRTPTV